MYVRVNPKANTLRINLELNMSVHLNGLIGDEVQQYYVVVILRM